jgi:hypothetical protein
MCSNPPADLLDQFPELKDRIGPRTCVLNDLSPAACHIAYNYTAPVEANEIRGEFERINRALASEFAVLYATEHYEPAVGAYDPKHPELASRLKNPPDGLKSGILLSDETPTWELLARQEVELRLGYSVRVLLGDATAASVEPHENWICIPATIKYTVWSDVYQCAGFITVEEPTGRFSSRGNNVGKPIVRKKRVSRGCHESIVLWSVAVDPVTREVRETFCCPHCNQEWKKLQLTRTKDVPVFTVLEFTGMPSANRSSRVRRGRPIGALDSAKLSDLEKAPLNRSFPAGQIDAGREMMRHGLLARGLTTESDFYSPRLLRGLSALWFEIQRAENARTRRALEFAFTGLLHRCSKLNRLRPSGAGDPLTGTLYIGSMWRENHVLDDFAEREAVLIGLASKTPAGSVFVRRGSATDLSDVPDACVDYIFTDPPFGSNIFYADCSMLWESWLGDYTDEKLEMVVSDRRVGGPVKTLDDYASMMTTAIGEMFRVLKPGRWATIEFNNSDGRVFEAIKRAVTEAGFQIVNMLLLDKAQKSFKQVKGATGKEDVVDKDVLFNLHKPPAARAAVVAPDHDLEQKIAAAVREHLRLLPERIRVDPAKYSDEHRTTATINSMLMNVLIPMGINVQRLNLPLIDRVCGRFFRKIGQQWYLRGEAVGNHTGWSNLIEEEVTITNEVSAIEWLRQKIRMKPALIGELKPLWMRATGLLSAELSQELALEDLLSENFWRDEDTNRWREPTDDEREKMNDDRSIRVLHDAERYVSGGLKRSTTDTERCEWIEVLFQACRAMEDSDAQAIAALRGFDRENGNRLVSRLFQSVLREKVVEKAFLRAQKQAAVASQKIAGELEVHAEAVRARKRKVEGPTLFDDIGDL